MDDRSYRDGCPPYCTCVDCSNKQINKTSNSKNFSKKFIYFLFAIIFLIAIIIIF